MVWRRRSQAHLHLIPDIGSTSAPTSWWCHANSARSCHITPSATGGGGGGYTVLHPATASSPSSSSSHPHRQQAPGVEVRAWVKGVPVEPLAQQQCLDIASLPAVQHPVVVMPDVHVGVGATVGTVVPTTRAIIPATVGVDIGCGMIAVKTSLTEEDLPRNLVDLRIAIEVAIPHGRTHNGDPHNDAGGWCGDVPKPVAEVWKRWLEPEFIVLCQRRPMLEKSNHVNHLATLGTGNHFVEVCLEEVGGAASSSSSTESTPPSRRAVWFMIHSGSRGVGSRIGNIFIELAKNDMGSLIRNLPNADLAYLTEGTAHFEEYVRAVHWAQEYARWNRELMMHNLILAVRTSGLIATPFTTNATAVNCHHNYVEKYFLPTSTGQASTGHVWLTRKGATSARKGELAVIPGSMGARSYIVRGKGNTASYESCSHGAGRQYSRGEATRRFTIADHDAATAGVECRKDSGVLDETPMAYKPIDAVMRAQEDLVEVVCALKQILCVKG